MNKIDRIFLWSGPRNISTTLMYSFAQRPDTRVYDEPLYGAYLKETEADKYHPGAQEIMDDMECDAKKVLEMMTAKHDAELSFFKNMTHHIMNLDKGFLDQGFNILLTRAPEQMLPSFDKVIPNPSVKDTGYKEHLIMLNYLKEEGIPYAVLDAKSTLLNPEEVLKKLCEKIGIAFHNCMLSWQKGARPEDGVWAKYWYDSIHNSTAYKPYEEKKTDFPKHLKPLLEEVRPMYEELASEAIQA